MAFGFTSNIESSPYQHKNDEPDDSGNPGSYAGYLRQSKGAFVSRGSCHEPGDHTRAFSDLRTQPKWGFPKTHPLYGVTLVWAVVQRRAAVSGPSCGVGVATRPFELPSTSRIVRPH